MITDADETNKDDIDSIELLHELYENGQDSNLTRLTEMVRQHYLNYLEKQLQENLLNSYFNDKKNVIDNEDDDYHEMCKKSIKKTAELLEDKAVKACMIAKFYQRAMVKIIAIVRRTTQEKTLISHLEKCIKSKDEHKPLTSSKETQTENDFLEADLSRNESITSNHSVQNADDKHTISLDEKIEMFQKHLQKDKYNEIVKKYPLNNKHRVSKRQHNHQLSHKQRGEQHTKYQNEACFSPASSVITPHGTPPPESIVSTKQPTLETTLSEGNVSNVVKSENSNDSVDVELARIFSEEKTELDEIFGIDPNAEPDDPHICQILKEIEDAKIDHTKLSNTEVPRKTKTQKLTDNPPLEPSSNFLEPKQQPYNELSVAIDLSKSIWPCELFMQRRKLSASLARLIEEDLRWYDVMKFKFYQLFDEDSDDEFTSCSPSIELNEVLIGSCIRRISPWVVKHLMKPMKDGLIGNRFLFKKLAKNLARSIIMENQYPDESIVKDCVENFFCLHQAVMSVEDLDLYTPSISSF